MNSSVKVLSVLAGLLAVALVYAYIQWPRQSRVAMEARPVSRTVSLPAKIDSSSKSDALRGREEQKSDAGGGTHNIFAPLFAPPVRVRKPAPVNTKPSHTAIRAVQPPVPAARPRPIFLGLLRHEGGQKAFLSVSGEVFVVGPGDRFGPDNSYRLLDISPQRLTVKDDREETSQQIAIEEPPVSVVASPGRPAGTSGKSFEPSKSDISVEAGALDEEVPIDEVTDE
jgi:hypothetical protein